jgi:hypothetical protein
MKPAIANPSPGGALPMTHIDAVHDCRDRGAGVGSNEPGAITGEKQMAIGKAVGEFSMTSTGVTVTGLESGGGANHVNLEGTATGFGTVIGTLTFLADEPGGKSGTTAWLGAGYLDNGDVLEGSGEGVYDEAGKHQWRVRAIIRVADGSVLLSDGKLSLKGRTYKGKLYAWT